MYANNPPKPRYARFIRHAMSASSAHLDRGLQGSVRDAVCAAEQNGESESVCESHMSDPLPLMPQSRAVLGDFSDETTTAGFQMARTPF